MVDEPQLAGEGMEKAKNISEIYGRNSMSQLSLIKALHEIEHKSCFFASLERGEFIYVSLHIKTCKIYTLIHNLYKKCKQ